MSAEEITKERQARDAILKQAVERLNEHFDSVRIFATVHIGSTNATEAYAASAGNRYAYELQIREWIECLDGRVIATIEDEGDEA